MEEKKTDKRIRMSHTGDKKEETAVLGRAREGEGGGGVMADRDETGKRNS